MPPVDSHNFSIDEINETLRLVISGKTEGKVVIRF